MGVSQEYANLIHTIRPRPTDAFGHANSLVENERRKINFDDDEFYHLLDKDVLLGNIKSDEVLKCYQIEIQLLHHLFYMAKRDAGLRPLFNVYFYTFCDEIGLTRTKDGREREAQTKVTGNNTLPNGGYGNQPLQEPQPQGNLFERLTGKNNQR
jgi:hypothetical protein